MAEQLFQLSPGIVLAPLDGNQSVSAYIVHHSNGRKFQVSEQAYHLLHCMKEPISETVLAEAFRERTGKILGQQTLAQILSENFMARGLVVRAGGAGAPTFPGPETTKANERSASLLELHYARPLVSAQTLTPLATAMSLLYQPFLAGVLIGLALLAHGFVYARLGIPPQLDMTNLSLSLLVVLIVLGILVHELGHIAACRYWHCSHGALGIGLYFFSPVLYVDVSESWRLSRAQRVVVDLGGIYFQLLWTLPLVVGFGLTRDPTYLWAVVFSNLFVLFNLNPIIRLDGYWAISDALGVPNLHRRVGDLFRFGYQWLRHARQPDRPRVKIAYFGQFSGGTLIAVIAYSVLMIDLWLILLGLVVPTIIDLVVNLPEVLRSAGQRLLIGVRTPNLQLILGGLELLLAPTFIAINLIIITVQMLKSAAEIVRRRRQGQ